MGVGVYCPRMIKYLVIVGVLVIVALGLMSTRLPGGAQSKEPLATSSTLSVEDDVGLQYSFESGTGTTTAVQLPKGVRMPDLDRPIVVPAYFLSDTAEAAKAEITKIIAEIKKSPDNAALWARLGLRRMSLEDYEGARQAYEYAYALSPDNVVVVDNLGVLYGYHLKDAKKAETYFLLALEIEPEQRYHYMRLYEFYRDVTNNSARATGVIERALKIFPKDPSFTSLLTR